MDFENKIKESIRQSVARNPDLFIMEMEVRPGHSVHVVIDGYRPVPVSECVRITREVEEDMDRETEDYDLTVSTADITKWFTDPRQLHKNKGKKLEVVAGGNTYEGILTELDDRQLVLEAKVREPKPVGKGKHTLLKRYEIPLTDFEKAKVKLPF